MPSGKYLMEDFCYAGGAPAVAKELGPLYRRDAVTVSGQTQGEIADRRQGLEPRGDRHAGGADRAVVRASGC